MSGRIRTVKPEWLEDELLAATSDAARVLSVALILMADDYGNGRASLGAIAPGVWGPQIARGNGVDATRYIELARTAIAELEAARFITIYEVQGQSYFSIRNWNKHQRVDKPGKPRVPGPEMNERPAKVAAPKVAYFIRGAATGLIKIGASSDPVGRLVDLAKAGSERLDLLAIGGVELDHHKALADDRVHGEWFRATPAVLAKVREYGGSIETPIASSGYDGASRSNHTTLAKVPGEVARPQEILAPDPDLRSPIPTTIPTTTASAIPRAPEPSSLGQPGDLGREVGQLQAAIKVALAGRGAPADLTSANWTEVATWCRTMVTPSRPLDVVHAVLARGFASDPKASKAGWSSRYLATNPNEYFNRLVGESGVPRTGYVTPADASAHVETTDEEFEFALRGGAST